jgi:hypothetical protein
MYAGFWLENLKERGNLGELGINRCKVKMELKETGWEGVDWMDLVQNRNKLLAAVNKVMNFQLSHNAGIS